MCKERAVAAPHCTIGDFKTTGLQSTWRSMNKQTKHSLTRVSFCNHLIPTLPLSFPCRLQYPQTLLSSMGYWTGSEQLSLSDRFHREVGRAQGGTGGRGKVRLALSLEHSVASPSWVHTLPLLQTCRWHGHHRSVHGNHIV